MRDYDAAGAKRRPFGLSGLALKLLALCSMTVDHVGAVLVLPRWGFAASLPLRYAGRLAFPIYCFLLVEGFSPTRSVPRYGLRLLGFALLTEPVYDRVLYGAWLVPQHQNILFTLALGLAAMAALRAAARRALALRAGKAARVLLCGALCLPLAAAACVLAQLLGVSYGWQGMVTILAYFALRRWPLAAAGAGAAVQFLGGNFIQYRAALAAVPIALYNGEKGRCRLPGWAFYLYYPAHLALLGLIARAF